ncbi:unnamed protein product [Didymodactylos carnosus]|uniref:RING-type E3 ubiquitin transferase n=1 Tax=Didymodactylos carnosus TaxID=1234261 RepID=A0A814IYU8_9BILA|nr:unnamed protein product [Didymodactylos carnosus]CAF1030990.1 unnamed protein product [Didymodactylos carnosus]CAF3705719.1 unnamed protein product [Didymodactylos carnosus]CAF3801738.1 unnamed protein product [Didymodactylos carnosus]
MPSIAHHQSTPMSAPSPTQITTAPHYHHYQEYFCCSQCTHDFDCELRKPITLVCGHTICQLCSRQFTNKCPIIVSKQQHQQPCNSSTGDIEHLYINYPILKLLMGNTKIPQNIDMRYQNCPMYIELDEKSKSSFMSTQQLLEDIILLLKPIGKEFVCPLNRAIVRKLFSLVNCSYLEVDGRIRALRQARNLGERIINDFLLHHQNPQQLTATLWSAVRARGCQFLGPAMQEEVLKLILLALMDGSALSRKVLVLFVVQKLAPQYPRASKTSVGHVVQLLYRASCFKVQKREDESSLMQLKTEYRTYEKLRGEHDSQIIAIAQEQGLRISPEQWSSLLYGDTQHKRQLELVIEKLVTPDSFDKCIKELLTVLARGGDPYHLQRLIPDFELLEKIPFELQSTSTSPTRHFDSISPTPDSNDTTDKKRELNTSWQFLCLVLKSSRTILQALIDFNDSTKQHHQQQQQQSSSSSLATSPLGGCGSDSLYGTGPSCSSGVSSSTTAVSKYKVSMCRDFTQKGSCPRNLHCTFAHSKQEMDKFRARNRRTCPQLQTQPTTTTIKQQLLPSPTPVQQYQSSLPLAPQVLTTTNPLNGLKPWPRTVQIQPQTDNFLAQQQQHYHHHHYHHLQQLPLAQTLQAPPMMVPTATSSTQIVAEAAQALINQAHVQAYYQSHHSTVQQQQNPHVLTVQMPPQSHQHQPMAS